MPSPDYFSDVVGDLLEHGAGAAEEGALVGEYGAAGTATPPSSRVTSQYLSSDGVASQAVSPNGEVDSGGDTPGTLKYYQKRLAEPLYPGARLTLVHFIYMHLMWKHECGLTNDAFDQSIQMLHHAFLPEDNLCPPSLYLFNRLAGVENLDDHEYHVCPCDKHLYGRLKKSEWGEHRHDKCLMCQAPRFKQLVNGSWEPTKRFYYFRLRWLSSSVLVG